MEPLTQRWKPEEDKALRILVDVYGPLNNWSTIAGEMQGRNMIQCREHWRSQLDPAVSNRPWTNDEDRIILEFVLSDGNKWSLIAKQLEGRTGKAIRDHWTKMKRLFDLFVEEETRRLETLDAAAYVAAHEARVLLESLGLLEHAEGSTEDVKAGNAVRINYVGNTLERVLEAVCISSTLWSSESIAWKNTVAISRRNRAEAEQQQRQQQAAKAEQLINSERKDEEDEESSANLTATSEEMAGRRNETTPLTEDDRANLTEEEMDALLDAHAGRLNFAQPDGEGIKAHDRRLGIGRYLTAALKKGKNVVYLYCTIKAPEAGGVAQLWRMWASFDPDEVKRAEEVTACDVNVRDCLFIFPIDTLLDLMIHRKEPSSDQLNAVMRVDPKNPREQIGHFVFHFTFRAKKNGEHLSWTSGDRQLAWWACQVSGGGNSITMFCGDACVFGSVATRAKFDKEEAGHSQCFVANDKYGYAVNRITEGLHRVGLFCQEPYLRGSDSAMWQMAQYGEKTAPVIREGVPARMKADRAEELCRAYAGRCSNLGRPQNFTAETTEAFMLILTEGDGTMTICIAEKLGDTTVTEAVKGEFDPRNPGLGLSGPAADLIYVVGWDLPPGYTRKVGAKTHCLSLTNLLRFVEDGNFHGAPVLDVPGDVTVTRGESSFDDRKYLRLWMRALLPGKAYGNQLCVFYMFPWLAVYGMALAHPKKKSTGVGKIARCFGPYGELPRGWN